jgi:hypothetical protein
LRARGGPRGRVVREKESNGTPATANLVSGFGSGLDEESRVEATGSLHPARPIAIGPLPEDDGSIPLAHDTGLVAGVAVRLSGFVGDGPFGSAGTGRGDFDFFLVPDVTAGQLIRVDVDTPVAFGPLDPFVAIFDSAGALLAVNDDDGFTFDSALLFFAPAAGDYFVSIAGFGSFIPLDPFDSSSGFTAASEGSYELTLGLEADDADLFSMQLEAGDILGASVSGAGGVLSLFDPGGTLRVSSQQDATFIHPPASPLPGGGNAVFSYVIDTPGTYVVRVDTIGSRGPYELSLRVFTNPLLDAGEGVRQTIFLDFGPATVDLTRFGGLGRRALSPLSFFLPRWGLSAAHQDALIDAIVARVVEKLGDDVAIGGNNGDLDASGQAGEFAIEILNSRDHPDPGPRPDVSRVIIAGTLGQFGLSNSLIGLAQSIDVGNFETDEVAVVLLDILSRPRRFASSLNGIPRAPGVTKLEAVAAGIGNIVAHEAGHYLGNFHTENFVTRPNIMDQGGNLPNTMGVGADGVFGTADDIDVDFGPDLYVPNEGFVGTEDTLNAIAFGLSTPIVPSEVGFAAVPANDTKPLPLAAGRVRVAVLGSARFDVDDLDPSTLRFGPAGATATSGPQTTDVDLDGFADWLLQLELARTGITPSDIELCFDASTRDGREIFGCDPIRVTAGAR